MGGRGSGSGAKRRSEGNGKLLREDASDFVLSDEVRNSVLNGTADKIPLESGKAMLQRGFSVTAKNGNEYSFGSDLVTKYESGIKQDGKARNEGSEVSRIRQIGRAVDTLKNPNQGIFNLAGDVPPQTCFLSSSKKRKSFAVFVDSTTKQVRAFYPVDNIESLKMQLRKRMF